MAADSSTPEVHQIVVIGASFGGLPTAQRLLKDILPAVSTTTKLHYKVILIAPNEHFYFKIGAPRILINPAKFPLEKGLLPIRDGFKQYPTDRFEFIHAYATAIDPEAKTIATSTSQTVHYNSLVIASGTNFKTSLWSTSNGDAALREAVAELHEKLPRATSVLVAGGGAVGVETAGELADLYGGGKKDIILLSGADQLLARLNNKDLGKEAEAKLTKAGVKVLHNVRISEQTTTADGKTELKLDDGSSRTVDVYIEATGDRPNSNFVPKAWLTERQQVKTDPQTLRLDVPGVQGVYVIGAVGSYSDGGIPDTKMAYGPILDSIRRDLLGSGENASSHSTSSPPSSSSSSSSTPVGAEPGWIEWLTSFIPFTAAAEAASKKPVLYKKITDTQFVPLGAKAGVGILMGWRIPQFAVVMFKSKSYMIGDPVKVVNGTY